MAAAAILAAGRSPAQEPPPRTPAQAEPPASGSTQPLSLRYHFVERYGLAEDRAKPELLVQYQIGSIETDRLERETVQGAPERREMTIRTIYTERPARVGRLGEVADTIRQYDMYHVDLVAPPRQEAPLLRGLQLWYHPRANRPPELIALTENRPIRQIEYDVVRKEVFFPRLASILPGRPVRVADTWGISRQAATAFIAEVPAAGDFQIQATLTKVEKASAATALTATIDITGTMDLPVGSQSVRARASFVFEPMPDPAADPAKDAAAPPVRAGARRDPNVVEARGFIAKLLMTLQRVVPIDEDGRLQEVKTAQLQLYRRRAPATLPTPEKPPTPVVANSWILYEDPRGRFRFRHPQELVLDDPILPDDLVLANNRANGSLDVLRVQPILRQPGVALDRSKSDPQAFVKALKAQLARKDYQFVDGPSGWLPEKEGEAADPRVYRLETAIKPEGDAAAVRNAARFYLDAYLVNFRRGDSFQISASTDRDDQVIFRDQAEGLIRSIEVGTATGPPTGATGQPPPARPSATPPAPGVPAAPEVPRPDGRP